MESGGHPILYNYKLDEWKQWSESRQPLLEPFMEFAFSLPEAERNREAEHFLFATYSKEINSFTLLLRLYLQEDTQFTEYAGVVDKEILGYLTKLIGTMPKEKQDTNFNAWLFEQGYHDIHLDYLELYRKQSPRTFIAYFRKQDEETQEQIIRTLMGLDREERNAKTDAKLDEQFMPLLERVGAQYVEETPSDG